MEAAGEYVSRANADSGWFAVFPKKWDKLCDAARKQNRQGANLVVYKTNTSDERDHFVIPHSLVSGILVESTLTHSKVNGTTRWNLTLRGDKLHVSHSPDSIDVSLFRGATLVIESQNGVGAISVFPDEISIESEYDEGAVQQVLVNRYERDANARTACIAHHGTNCSICGFDFGLVYGEVMDGFIHIHHLIPLAKIKSEYQVNPKDDLRPVCPNCHAVIHRRREPYSIEDIKDLLGAVQE